MAIFVGDFLEKTDFVLSATNLNKTQAWLALEIIEHEYRERKEEMPTGIDLERLTKNYGTKISVWRRGDHKDVKPGLIPPKYLPILASVL